MRRQRNRKTVAAMPNLHTYDFERQPRDLHVNIDEAYKLLLLTVRGFAIVNVTRSVSASSAIARLVRLSINYADGCRVASQRRARRPTELRNPVSRHLFHSRSLGIRDTPSLQYP
jgi:hypothetical protein